MKTRLLYLSMIVAAVVCSCQKEEMAQQENDGDDNAVVDFVPEPGKILAMTPNIPETKIAFKKQTVEGGTSVYPVVWTVTNAGEADKIKLFSLDALDGEEYVFTPEKDESGNNKELSTAIFKGNPIEGDNVKYAIFPSTRADGLINDGDDTELIIDFGSLAKQSYHSSLLNNSSNLKYMPMVAVEDPENKGVFAFENLCGIIMFRFNDYQEMRPKVGSIETAMKIKSVKITSKSHNITGIAKYNVGSKTLTLTDEKDSEITDPKTIEITYDGQAIQSTDDTPTVTQSGKLGWLIALPAGTYEANDLTVTITDDKGRVYEKTISTALEVQPGVARSMPTLSFTFSYGEANCVVIKPGETGEIDIRTLYTFEKNFLKKDMIPVKDIEGNDFVENGVSPHIEWEITGTGTELTSNTVISSVVIESGKLKVVAGQEVGNALVSLKDKHGTILWSWHIWVIGDTLDDVVFENCTNKPTFQSLNLGATQNTLASEEGSNITNTYAVGLFYQYGRKDPFVTGRKLGYKDKTPYLTTDELTSTVEYDSETESPCRIDWATQHPTKRIVATSLPQEVKTAICLDNWTGAANDSKKYWGAEKTIYDPCPDGYRVPQYSDFEELGSKNAPGVLLTPQKNKNRGWVYSADVNITPSEENYDPKTMIYFPNSGYLLQGTITVTETVTAADGTTSQVTTYYNTSSNTDVHMFTWRAFCWTTTESGDNIRTFPGGATGDHLTTSSRPFVASRASANNIRCLKIAE